MRLTLCENIFNDWHGSKRCIFGLVKGCFTCCSLVKNILFRILTSFSVTHGKKAKKQKSKKAKEQKDKYKKREKGVNPHLGVTLKCWLPKPWSTPVDNILLLSF